MLLTEAIPLCFTPNGLGGSLSGPIFFACTFVTLVTLIMFATVAPSSGDAQCLPAFPQVAIHG